jgi:tRNA (cytidine/uridine-2'-O-)-methyltransferase
MSRRHEVFRPNNPPCTLRLHKSHLHSPYTPARESIMPHIHIVLYQPEIPANTGNIIRLCYLNNLTLHLIEPLGFSLDDAALRRAGIDYWDKFRDRVELHPDWDTFLARHPEAAPQTRFFTAHTTRSFWDAAYSDPVFLVFGRETAGLPQEFHVRYADQLVTIPKRNPEGRSLNLSNAVSVAVYEVMRRFRPMEG